MTRPDPLLPADDLAVVDGLDVLGELLADDLSDAAGATGWSHTDGWSPQLVGLLAAARRPAEAGELAGEATTVAAMSAAIDDEASGRASRRQGRRRVVRRVLVAKTTIAAAVALGVATAAAATGVAAGWVPPGSGDHPQRPHAPLITLPPPDDPFGAEPGSTSTAPSTFTTADPDATGRRGGTGADDAPGKPAGGSATSDPSADTRDNGNSEEAKAAKVAKADDTDGAEEADETTGADDAPGGPPTTATAADPLQEPASSPGEGADSTPEHGRPADKGPPPGQAKKATTGMVAVVALTGG